MHTWNRNLIRTGRVAAALLFTAAASLSLHAQQPATATPRLDLQAELKAPSEMPALFGGSAMSYSSSSSASDDIAATSVAAEHLTSSSADEGIQPPPRRRYGRPRYTDSMHNADGSNKYAFAVGGGFTLPTGGTHAYFATSYDFQAGVGRNFNKNFGVMVDFNWANFGMQTNTLNNQIALYNSLGATDENGDSLSQLGGSGHVWSFALDPIYNFYGGDRSGAYVTGGVGFYHKTSTFTIPALQDYCTYYYGCIPYEGNAPIDSYTSNAPGVNGGVGFTYKFSEFSSTRLFAEARYVYTFNSRRAATGTTAENTPPGSVAFNAFPENSAPTSYIPITFGIRF